VGHSRFVDMERDYADFTYLDSYGDLTRLFYEQGVAVAGSWLGDDYTPITYHLEVKSTTGACSEEFYMSNIQVDKVLLSEQDRFLPTNRYPGT
jgi:hypothetical protein